MIAQGLIKTPRSVCHGQNGNVRAQNLAAIDNNPGLK